MSAGLKSSQRRKRELLIVDGYNILGVWLQNGWIKTSVRDDERQLLIDHLADYQGYSGQELILVFDAYSVDGGVKLVTQNKLEIHFSARDQTADQYIESLVGPAVESGRTVYVATADQLEQTIVFAKGALRISARELWHRLQAERSTNKNFISEDKKRRAKSTLADRLSDEQRAILERWRREK